MEWLQIAWPQSFNPLDLVHWASGQSGAGSSYMIARWIFLRALGIVYLIAFISLWVQIKGLIGSDGILPIQEYLGAARSQLGAERYQMLPTIFWLNASDVMLHIVCALGVLCSVLLILGFAPAPSLFILWALYLSLTVAGQTFLSFQWDILLIEVGFLAIFLAPFNLWPGLQYETAISPLILLLLWWLLFRFVFESGVVKLTSGDPSWTNLTALTYHYETQPLTTWTGWFVHQMPLWFHKGSVLFNHIIEIGFPFLILGTRNMRITGAFGMIVLQVIIGITGNYNFFNLLTIALCFLLLDDVFWTGILPERFLSWIGEPVLLGAMPVPILAFAVFFAIVAVIVGGVQIANSIRPGRGIPGLVRPLVQWTQPFYLVNPYGLFRVMTKERPEIIVEGSNDRKEWQPYEFKYKPGDVQRRPGFVEPHQPRLDWQMWFAALRPYQYVPWFQNFLVRLLEGSPDVLALLEHNPFPGKPPQYIRAVLYDYKLTNWEEKRETKAWWKRQKKGLYSPVLSLTPEKPST